MSISKRTSHRKARQQMAILINNMDLPNTCGECILHRSGAGHCELGIKIEYLYLRSRECPLKEVNEKPSGKWEIKDKMWWVCSNCGCQTRMMKKYNVPNFCPACGAKMVEP